MDPAAAVIELGLPPAGQYKGTVRNLWYSSDPEASLISGLIGDYGGIIDDCQYKDFGVGFLRDDAHGFRDVAVSLGTPAEAPKPADVQCPAGSVTPTVPPDQHCAAPTNTVTMNITKRGLTNATVTISAWWPTSQWAAASSVRPDRVGRNSSHFTI